MPGHQTGYQPDSVAVVCAGNEIDGALQKRLQRVGFRVQMLGENDLAQLRPGSIVINASACAGLNAMPAARRLCEALTQHEHCGYLLHLSSYRVFPGARRKHYDEEEIPAPNSEAGRQWLACEQALAGRDRVTILRFGWMVDRNGDALLGRILRGLVARQSIALDDSSRGSPVTVMDMARVTVALAQQLASGAPASGVYHYGSADSCTALEFAREVVERAQSFYDEDLSPQLSALSRGEEEHSVVLAGNKLRDVFGIQPRSWRQGLTRQVEIQIAEIRRQMTEKS